MKKKEVRNQQEFDACVAKNNIAVVIGCKIVARGNSTVEAWENGIVVARENSKVVAWENSTVEAWDNSTVEAWGNSTVIAWGNTFIRFFSCLKITASQGVVILKHNKSDSIDGGRQLDAIKIQ